MSIIVTIGGVVLTPVAGVGYRRTVSAMPGWDDAPAARTSLQPRMQQDGARDAAGTSAERVIDIPGWVFAETPADAYVAQRELAALRPQAVYELLVDNDAIGPLTVMARVTAAVKTVRYSDRSFSYTLQVTAPDPLKYGPRTFATATLSSDTPGAGLIYPLAYPVDYGLAPGVTPGAVRVTNFGTAAYWPTLRIDGPVTHPIASMVETGAWVRYGKPLLSGQWLDIDLANRRVLLQGQVSVRHDVTFYGDWLSVQPGGGSVTWTADVGDPAALLSVWSYEGAWS